MKLPTVAILDVYPQQNHFAIQSVPPVESLDTFAMVPWAVGSDQRLKHVDVRIYFVLAACRRGSTVKLGTRLLAKYACTSLRHVSDGLARLISCGYVESEQETPGARTKYKLTSAWFSHKAAPKTKAVEPVAARRRGPHDWVTCQTCYREVPSLLRVGWCRRCNRDKNVEHISRRVAREEIEKSA